MNIIIIYADSNSPDPALLSAIAEDLSSVRKVVDKIWEILSPSVLDDAALELLLKEVNNIDEDRLTPALIIKVWILVHRLILSVGKLYNLSVDISPAIEDKKL